MAIVEEIQDTSTLRSRAPTKDSKQKSKPNAQPTIPLVHPSTLPKPTAPPLLNVPPPGTIPDGAKVHTVRSAKEIEMLQRQLEEEREEGEDEEDEDEEHARQEEGDDVIFNTLIMAVPFTFLYLMLDILVHLQYSHRPGWYLLGEHVLKALPTLSLLVYYTNAYPTHPLTNSFLMSASILAGCRLIWLVNKASWSTVTAQAPPMGTLWIFTIVQLPLGRALLTLMFVGGWFWYSGLKFAP
ncbi:hypothetical protein I312_100651 [Cryptococcus bacillisporus CA1280]|uniref:uncharacterized protein n=1 Tax=Cryptococcus bacillisporus CA1280 TaxID=1296109 RepID=UPI00336759BF